MHITRSNRARRQLQLTAFGATALVTTLAVAGPAGAAGTITSGAETPRITVSSTVSCSPSGTPFLIDFFYDDHVDGHVPQAVQEELVEGSTVLWTRDELYQEQGDYFNTLSFPQAGPLNPTGAYTYSVTITYDDGVTQTQSTNVDVAATQCPAAPSTTTPATTVPGGSLPETGSGNLTWIIGSLAGLIMTVGAALFAGTRRRRID